MKENWSKNIARIQKICVSVIAGIICVWAFFHNNGFLKVVLSPFILCSFAMALENICLLLQREKLAHFFRYTFRISFFVYFFGFLGYTTYYSVSHKSYDLLLPVAIFLIFGIHFFKKAFFRKKGEKE